LNDKEQPVKKNRLVFIDLARSIAIALVLSSHFILEFIDTHQMSESKIIMVTFFTQIATPMIFIIFGAMLGFITVPKMGLIGFKQTVKHLQNRSLLCYAGYVFSLFLAILVGKVTLRGAGSAAVFLGTDAHNEVLKYYAVEMFVAIPLIWLCRKRPYFFPILTIAFVWALDPLLKSLSWPDPSHRLAYLTSLFFGRPLQPFYSIFHSLTFVSVGFLLGRGLYIGYSQDNWTVFRHLSLLIACFALSIIFVCVPSADWPTFLTHHLQYRRNHHYIYYAGSIFNVSMVIYLLSLIVQPSTQQKPHTNKC